MWNVCRGGGRRGEAVRPQFPVGHLRREGGRQPLHGPRGGPHVPRGEEPHATQRPQPPQNGEHRLQTPEQLSGAPLHRQAPTGTLTYPKKNLLFSTQ